MHYYFFLLLNSLLSASPLSFCPCSPQVWYQPSFFLHVPSLTLFPLYDHFHCLFSLQFWVGINLPLLGSLCYLSPSGLCVVVWLSCTFVCFWDRVSLYRSDWLRTLLYTPCWPQTHRDVPASVSYVLWLKAWTTVQGYFPSSLPGHESPD